MLFPLGHREEDWVGAEETVQTAIEHLGVFLARGLSQCRPYVRAGAASLFGSPAEDALVFACPADIGIFEAAPLVSGGEPGALVGEIATFFRIASEAALGLAPKIAWIAAHDWSPGNRVRWDSGDVDRLVSFASSPFAWRTAFLLPVSGQVQLSDDWPYWFEVSRGSE